MGRSLHSWPVDLPLTSVGSGPLRRTQHGDENTSQSRSTHHMSEGGTGICAKITEYVFQNLVTYLHFAVNGLQPAAENTKRERPDRAYGPNKIHINDCNG